MIREYLDIQNIRHRTENQMQDSIEEALLSREIPPLLLLTFVENAVKHAELNAWNLTVCILVSRLEEQQKLRFIVKNNGSKFPDEYLELLNDPAYYLDGGSHGGRGVGIRNIHKRLSLIYGNRFSLHFYNSDKGACSPALGFKTIGSEHASINCGSSLRICFGPKPQLNPTASAPSPSTIATALKTSAPVNSLPSSSNVNVTITGRSQFSFAAKSAALIS